MRRFIVLLKKEIKELLTLQMIIPLLVSILALVFIGNVVGKEAERAMVPQEIAILDRDESPLSRNVLDMLVETGFKVKEYRGISLEMAKDEVEEQGLNGLLVIPAGFGDGLEQKEQQQIEVYNILRSFSIMGGGRTDGARNAIRFINEYLSSILILSQDPGADPEMLKNPVVATDHVIIADKEAQAHPDQIMGFISTQTMFIPIVLFVVIVFSSQIIVASVAAEKENKTLETLLTTPIKRTYLVTAKMMAAGLIALLVSVFYMVGFRQYMGGIMGAAMPGSAGDQISNLLVQLGLVLTPTSYILLGLSIFFGILCVLAISLILGVFANDVKSAQTFVTPIIFLVMIPYLLSLFLDLHTVSPVIRYLVFAIPFAHPFMAMSNLFLGNQSFVVGGIIYQGIIFLIFVFLAARIFSSDRIMTMKLKLSRKKTS